MTLLCNVFPFGVYRATRLLGKVLQNYSKMSTVYYPSVLQLLLTCLHL